MTPQLSTKFSTISNMACCGWLFAILSIIFVLAALLKLYLKLTTGWCYSKKCLVGKTVIVTGANIGIGYETARDFAMRGARVILACRDPKKAEDAKKRIIEDTENENIVVKIVDMASLDSVRQFAKDINSSEKRLDILVNNAGIGPGGPEYTKEGNVYTYQVNYFSHFLLTILLIDLLKKSKASRIVNVSSLGARNAQFELDQIGTNPPRSTTNFQAYYNSKLFQILFTKELAKRLEGTGVTVFSLHPGTVKTDFVRKTETSTWFHNFLIIMQALFFKDTLEGAQTTLHVSLEKDLEKYNGKHFSDCKPVEYQSAMVDSALLRKFWVKSTQLVALTPEESRI